MLRFFTAYSYFRELRMAFNFLISLFFKKLLIFFRFHRIQRYPAFFIAMYTKAISLGEGRGS